MTQALRPLRVILFARGPYGREAVAWLARREDADIQAVVTEASQVDAFATALTVAKSDYPHPVMFLDADKTDLATVCRGTDIGVSVLYHKRLPVDVLELFPRGVVNLHPSYLPYNRGELPATWAIIDGTPAGATLHYMDKGLDTGPIIQRWQVPVTAWDTAWDVYHRSMATGIAMLKHLWSYLVAGPVESFPQPPGGSYHRRADIEALDNLGGLTGAGEHLMRILRARTWYDGEPGNAYYEVEGKRVRVRVQLTVDPAEDGAS